MDTIGKCSKPMWRYPGVPAGFCDNPAYGEQLEGNHKDFGYVRRLACHNHGGPTRDAYMKDKTVIRFDGPPGPESGRFVEVERNGQSINAGEWLEDGEDWLLVMDESTCKEEAQ